jgi:hypothetical protein
MPCRRSVLALVQISFLLLTNFFLPTKVAQAQGVLDITVGKPSIWTLAQAHYLLAQMHKTDRSWQVASLGTLDPNSINRQRIEVLQTLSRNQR